MLFENPILEMVVLKRGNEGAFIYIYEGVVVKPAYLVKEVDIPVPVIVSLQDFCVIFL